MWLGLWHTEAFLHQNVLVCSLWLREGHRDQNGGGGCECFPGELQGVPVSDRRGCLSCLQPGCCLLMLAAEAPDEVGELCRSQKCKRRPYVRYRCQVRSSSAVGAGSEQEGPRVNWGGGRHQLHHTHSKQRRAFCLEQVCLILLGPLRRMPEPTYSQSRDLQEGPEPSPQKTNTQKVTASHSPPVWNLREESRLELQNAGSEVRQQEGIPDGKGS